MRRPMLWAALILGALLLYLVWRRSVPKGEVLHTDTNGALVPKPLVDPNSLPPPTDAVDVAPNIGHGTPNGYDGWVLRGDYGFRNETGLWDQFMAPAGRVRLFADIPRQYWNIMFGLIAMTLDRKEELSSKFQIYSAEIAQQQEGQTVDSIVGGIVAAIAGVIGGPIVSALLKYAVNTQVAQLGAAIAQEQATIAFVAKLQNAANHNKLPASVPLMLDGGDSLDDAKTLADAFNFPPDVREAVGIEGIISSSVTSKGVSSIAPMQPWHKSDGGRYYFPASWFFQTRLGWLMPWLSSEIIGSDVNQTINKSARVARALDYFRTLVSPRMPGYTSNLYWYRNKVFGDVMGSYFPPTEEDTYLILQGQMFAYDGTPKMDPRQIPMLKFTPPAYYVPDADDPSQRGDGGEFSPHGMPLGQVPVQVFTPPPPSPVNLAMTLTLAAPTPPTTYQQPPAALSSADLAQQLKSTTGGSSM